MEFNDENVDFERPGTRHFGKMRRGRKGSKSRHGYEPRYICCGWEGSMQKNLKLKEKGSFVDCYVDKTGKIRSLVINEKGEMRETGMAASPFFWH